MKKLVFLGVLIIIAVSFVAGRTGASFYDSVEVEGNTFTAGTLTLDLVDETGFSVEMDNLAPGEWSETKELEVENTGSLDLEIEELSADGFNAHYEDCEADDDFESHLIVALGDLADPLVEADIGELEDGEELDEKEMLETEESHAYDFQFKLDEETPNEYQGCSLEDVTFEIEASQS